MRNLQWPNLADTTTAAGVAICVYEDSAMLDPPLSDYGYEQGDHQFFLDAQELQALAVELLWAAERLLRRDSPRA